MRLKGKLKLFFLERPSMLYNINEYQKQRPGSYPRIPGTRFSKTLCQSENNPSGQNFMHNIFNIYA